MNNYYCPYCNPKYQWAKKSSDGKLICGLCGDDLVKKPLIKINKIIAIIAALSFLLPLFYTFIFLIKKQIKSPNRNQQEITAHLKKSKSKIYYPLHSDLFIQE